MKKITIIVHQSTFPQYEPDEIEIQDEGMNRKGDKREIKLLLIEALEKLIKEKP